MPSADRNLMCSLGTSHPSPNKTLNSCAFSAENYSVVLLIADRLIARRLRAGLYPIAEARVQKKRRFFFSYASIAL